MALSAGMILRKMFSESSLKRDRRVEEESEPDQASVLKRQKTDATDQQQQVDDLPSDLAPPARLQPLLQRWGDMRLPQLLDLYAALGDGPGGQRSSSLSKRFETALQVWGPPGTGKTQVVSNYLDVLGIPHVWIDCFCISSQADLHGRVAKLMARLAEKNAVATTTTTTSPNVSQRQLHSLDRFQAALRGSLDTLDRADIGKVVIVFDHIEELPRRLGQGALNVLLSWPEVLDKGNLLSLVTIGRVPMEPGLGLLDNRAPPEVVFQPYSDQELQELLLQLLPKMPQLAGVGRTSLEAVVYGGLLKFAVPFLGRNLDSLLSVGKDVLLTIGNGAPPSSSALYQLVEEASKKRTGFLHLGSGLGSSEDPDLRSAHEVAAVNVKSMTKAEMRLGLAAYLSSRLDKMDDRQLFLSEGDRRRRRRQPVTKHRRDDDIPAHAKAPRSVPLTRLLAIYHRLARQPALIGSHLFDTLASMRESGLVRLIGDKSGKLDREPKVACRAELRMAVAWAKELKIDLAEYLSK
eukprot:TRINITY_DN13063_c0_g1_i1.p1 TRINITY_DN13063_c0_g1~~TRINITY_DN13063_c0_g1_i1.p1  ORF type:complete len:520 (-),score=91.78 TRINITY_DN13063_c0_g1_i1:156-1715(-)